MILALLAALVIHTYDGQDRIITDIEPRACEMSRCMVLYGTSCGQVVAEGVKAEMSRRKEAADQTAWEAANPRTQKKCLEIAKSPVTEPVGGLYCGPQYGRWGRSGIVMTASGGIMSTSATKSAMCIRQKDDK